MQGVLRLVALGISVSALVMVQGCATRVKATATENPAPKEAFSAFGNFELKPAVFEAGFRGDAAGLAKIEENIKKELGPKIETWNKKTVNGRKLIIEPVVDDMQFQHGAKRVLLGPMAGSSGVLMWVKITDASSGAMVANPEFFQRAGAWSAGFVMGVHDNIMMVRVASLPSSYMVANYETARGGPTGADSANLNN